MKQGESSLGGAFPARRRELPRVARVGIIAGRTTVTRPVQREEQVSFSAQTLVPPRSSQLKLTCNRPCAGRPSPCSDHDHNHASSGRRSGHESGSETYAAWNPCSHLDLSPCAPHLPCRCEACPLLLLRASPSCGPSSRAYGCRGGGDEQLQSPALARSASPWIPCRGPHGESG